MRRPEPLQPVRLPDLCTFCVCHLWILCARNETPTVPTYHGITSAAPVAGHEAWSDTYRSPSDVLTVDAGRCRIRFTKSRQLTAAQLHDVADRTRYLDCAHESTWRSPVG